MSFYRDLQINNAKKRVIPLLAIKIILYLRSLSLEIPGMYMKE